MGLSEFYNDGQAVQYLGNAMEMAQVLEPESIQCVVTSPPYWGLRKYSGEQELVWGDDHCEHEWVSYKRPPGGGHPSASAKVGATKADVQRIYDGTGAWCNLCGAWRGSYGCEPTVGMYIDHSIQFLEEIRRVLRKDGVVFWVIGDSYASGKGTCFNPGGGIHSFPSRVKEAGGLPLNRLNKSDLEASGLKPKDLCLIPQRIAIAAQEAGWWVRQDIIWYKKCPMPESVTDRPTRAHEHILMLAKAKKYYWDKEAVLEPYTEPLNRWGGDTLKRDTSKTAGYKDMLKIGYSSAFRVGRPMRPNPAGRNIRSVWELSTAQTSESHYAAFPEALPEKCIMAATKPDDLVLDPFCGTGTTLRVAKRLGRRAVGIDIAADYCEMTVKGIRQMSAML